MKVYEVIEIISAKTKNFCMMVFESDKDMTEYLNGRRMWNADNKQYSITAWVLDYPEAFIDFTRYGYKEI